jgi:hypothetical protein
LSSFVTVVAFVFVVLVALPRLAPPPSVQTLSHCRRRRRRCPRHCHFVVGHRRDIV